MERGGNCLLVPERSYGPEYMYFVTCPWSFGLRQAKFVVIIIIIKSRTERPIGRLKLAQR